jgi:hypothetical protein
MPQLKKTPLEIAAELVDFVDNCDLADLIALYNHLPGQKPITINKY